MRQDLGVFVRGIVLVSMVLQVGCSPEEESNSISVDQWLDDYPVLFCAVQVECNADYVQDLYQGEKSQCVDAIREHQTERIEEDGCGFDGEAGKVCLDALEDMTCARWEEGEGNCGDVVDCSSG